MARHEFGTTLKTDTPTLLGAYPVYEVSTKVAAADHGIYQCTICKHEVVVNEKFAPCPNVDTPKHIVRFLKIVGQWQLLIKPN